MPVSVPDAVVRSESEHSRGQMAGALPLMQNKAEVGAVAVPAAVTGAGVGGEGQPPCLLRGPGLVHPCFHSS